MRTFCGERPCRAPQMAHSASRCLRRQKGGKRRWAEIAEGLRRAWIRKGVGCPLGGLQKKAGIQGWFGTSLSPGKLCHAVPRARELQPLQGEWHPPRRAGAGTLPAPRVPCRSGKLCSAAQTSPSGCPGENGNRRCLHFTEGETETEDIGAASKFRADPPGFLTRRHFSWELTIPHALLVFSPQRTRILHFSAWETSFFLRSSMFVISMNW